MHITDTTPNPAACEQHVALHPDHARDLAHLLDGLR